MKLLGHRDYRITLRYTQIADETVGREYFEALTRISYELLQPNAEEPVGRRRTPSTAADPET